MNKGNVKKINPIRATALVVLALSLLAAAFIFFGDLEKKQGHFTGEANGNDGVISYNDKEYVLNEKVETFLVVGLDAFNETSDDTAFRNDKLADFLLLLVMDNENGTVCAVHINRDTMADINVLDIAGKKTGTINRQIALAHTYGNGKEVSCRNTADAVSKLLMDIKINHYVSVTMDAVKGYNDLVGGVTLEVLDDFTSIDETLVKGDTLTLTGEQALTYVRARGGLEDSSNVRRMERQRQYLSALYEKTKSNIAEDEKFSALAASELSKHMVSDCTVTQLQNLIKKVVDYTTTEIYSPKGSSVKGEEYMEFTPDKGALKELAIKLFFVPKEK